MKTFVVAIGFAVLAGAGIAAQQKAATAPSKAYTPGKTSWGDPNLQGIYTDKDENGIPLERPNQFDGKQELDDSELADVIRERQARAVASAATIGGSAGADTGAGPVHWYEHYGAKNSRPWMVTDPADGKIPPLTEAAQQRAAARAAARSVRGPADSFEDRSLYDQCITRGVVGSMLPVIYGNSFQIVQAPGYVAIRYEMIHEDPRDPDGRPAARRRRRSARTWATRAATGKATRWSSRRPTSRTGPRSASTATGRSTARPCGWSSASRRSRRRGRVESHRGGPGHVDAAVDLCAEFDERRDPGRVRIRLPRRQLRHAQHPQRGARGRTDGTLSVRRLRTALLAAVLAGRRYRRRPIRVMAQGGAGPSATACGGLAVATGFPNPTTVIRTAAFASASEARPAADLSRRRRPRCPSTVT